MNPVWIIDDDRSIRWVLEKALGRESIAATSFGSADEALEAFENGLRPQVLISDIRMPGSSGLDLLRRGRLHWPRLRWLVFTMHDSPALLGQALRAGAQGFVTKAGEPDELVRALRRVAAGEAPVLSSDMVPVAAAAATAPPHQALSPREFDVLRLLAQGLTLAEVAERLHVSPKTVSNLQTRIRARLGVGTAVELLRYAQVHRLFQP
jgi:DNA-binding NarL/FixJ family response regulator